MHLRHVPYLLVFLLIGCASVPQNALYDYAQLSKASAEGLYQAIYAASRQGQVPPDALAQARVAYTQWSLSQYAYLNAAEDGRYDIEQAHNMQVKVHVLMSIATHYGVAPWVQKSP